MSTRCNLLFPVLVALLPMSAVQSGEKGTDAPEVSVARPIVREVTDYHETTGRLQASARVKLRALANGILTAVRFKDGDQVKQGDVLFEIDPRPYQARHDQAQSQVELAKATLQLARATLTRDLAAAKATPGSVSQQQLDQDKAAVNEGAARVKAAEAGAALTKLDLDFCKVKAPFAGRIGRALVDPGNIVREDQTQELAVLVRDDPIYVDFEISERTYLDLMLARREGLEKLPVEAAVRGDEKFSRRGEVRIVDRFARESGGISLQATLENKDRLLLPGNSLRVRFALRGPYKAMLLREGIVKAKLDRSYVFVVDAKDKVQIREVTLGGEQPDELRVIAKGLTAEDRVIVGRTTGLKPGMAVRPKQVEMPASTSWLDDSPPRVIRSAQRPLGFGVRVDGSYAVAQAQAVYDDVGFPIESQVSGLEGVNYLRSRCTRDGRYTLDIAFASGVDLERAEARVKDRMARELPKLPADVRAAGVQVRGGGAGVLQIIRLTSTDDTHDRAFLGNYAKQYVKSWLAREIGVADVAMFGGADSGVRIQLDMDRMRAYKVSAAEVVQLLRKEKRQPGMKPWALEDIILRAN
ncbi:MAG TPA: efflux RND transporter periplasmic adaptor subunit, partial [Gemmataceae bacterium]|nr:efflux RND transporter periplasmic adaptor subunit [Gemmataceae bacterium]